MPAVVKTWMPARSAITMVPATVVAPRPPPASAPPMSRALIFGMPLVEAKRSMRESVRPTTSFPPAIPMVAGTAPAPRTAFSISEAVSDEGSVVMSEDSSATTGRRSASAVAISSLTSSSWSGCRSMSGVSFLRCGN